MATKEVGSGGSIFDCLREEIVERFNAIQREFLSKREALLSKVAQMELEYSLLNKETDSAIIQLEKLKVSTMGLLTSNLLTDEPSDITRSINEKIDKLKQSKIPLPHVELEYNIDLLRKALNSIDVIVPLDQYSNKKLPIVKVGRKGIEKGSINEPGGVCSYKGNSNIYVADQSGRIVILNNEGEFIEEFTHSKLLKPWGVSVYNNYVYATDYSSHLLFKFSLLGECCVVRGGKGEDIGKFRSPLGVFVEDMFVYVCDELNHRIQIFNLNLEYQGKLSIDGKPQDIKIHQNLIYILALFQPDILVYSKKGVFVNSIVFSDTIEKMYFFAIDYSGNFVFTGEEKNLIFICSPQGELVATLGKGICNAPQGVTVDSMGRVICVCNAKKDVLQIY